MDQQHRPTHRRLTRAEVRRRRRSRAIRRVAGLTAVVCLVVGGAAFLLNRKAPVPSASAAGAPASSAASETNGLLTDRLFPGSAAESTSAAASEGAEESRDNALGLTKAEAAAMLADPANPVFTLRVGDAFAGLIGFKSADSTTLTIEIGYWLRSEYQGRGLMTAAAEALCRMAFGQMGMENVEIKCAAGNLRSNRIPLRLGFRLDRIEVRGEQLADGEFTDLNVYRLPRP